MAGSPLVIILEESRWRHDNECGYPLAALRLKSYGSVHSVLKGTFWLDVGLRCRLCFACAAEIKWTQMDMKEGEEST